MKVSSKCTYVLAAFVATVLLSMAFMRPQIVRSKIGDFRSAQDERTTPKHTIENTFLLLKTGIEVAYGRLPAHINTTLKRFPHHAVYADVNTTIEGIQIIDSISFLPEHALNSPELLGYRVRRQMIEQHWNRGNSDIMVNNEKTGWILDKFKNVPAFAEAWARNQDFDWYVMIDADTYLASYTLDEDIKDKNPNDIWYLGKSVSTFPFAHGGSGIVLSRGAMKLMYGETDESIQNTLEGFIPQAFDDCCGDSLVARVYQDKTGRSPAETLQPTEHGQYQGARTMNTVIRLDEQWCNPVGVFHGVHPWEIYELDAWEKDIESKSGNLSYYEYYRKFVMPTVSVEKPNWVTIEPPGSFGGRKWLEFDAESQDKDLCKNACDSDPDCTMWVFTRGASCATYRNLVIGGEARNKYGDNWDEGSEYVTGYMIDRIRERRATLPCDKLLIEEADPNEREGWLHEQLRKNGRDSTEIMNVSGNRIHVNNTKTDL